MSNEERLELRLGRVRLGQQPGASSQEALYAVPDSADSSQREAQFSRPRGCVESFSQS